MGLPGFCLPSKLFPDDGGDFDDEDEAETLRPRWL